MKTFKNICTGIVVCTLALVGIICLGVIGIEAAAEHDQAEMLEWRAKYDADQERLDKTIKFLKDAVEIEEQQEKAAANK